MAVPAIFASSVIDQRRSSATLTGSPARRGSVAQLARRTGNSDQAAHAATRSAMK
ncbi:MAG TPA: hypothetical protein VNP92_28995 [Actinophytocola sp.]|nr:hypothetical protein [Actinophytocola sp.]